MHTKRAVSLTIIGSIASIAISMALSFGLSWWYIKDTQTAQLQSLAKTSLDRANRTFKQSRELLDSFNSLKIDACSEIHIDTMHAAVLEHNEIEEIGFIQNGLLTCTSFGRISTPIEEKPPIYTTKDGLGVAINVKSALNKRSARIALQGGSYNVFINPKGFADPIVDDSIRLGVVTNNGVILGRLNNPDQERMTKLVTGTDDVLEDSRLFVIVRSDDLSAVASESEDKFMQAITDGYGTALLGGSILSALLIALVLWHIRKKLSPLSLLAQALENKQFIVHYQPIIDLATGRCVGAEALVRWQKEDGTMVSPDLFIPLAERSGLILPLTDQIIAMMVKEMAIFLEKRPEMHIAINISAQDMKTGRILDVMNNALSQSSIKPDQIWLEATERGLIDIKAARIVIQNARNAGYHIAIDDFGTGYSSLSHLQGLPLDTLKVDKSFIDTIETGGEGNLTNHIIAMARTLKLSIVAEGIENPEQASYLDALHVEYGQGWLYSKALPAEEFILYCEQVDAKINATAPTSTPHVAPITH